MKKQIITVAAVLTAGLIAGCGGGSSPASSTTVSGKVADGYLVKATVFMDKNNNYQLDANEPHTTTDANGAYTLMNVDPADVGKYPIVAIAIKGQTLDKDTNQSVSDSYVLSMPAAAVFGTHSSNFISPMSTLIREKMTPIPNRPAMTLTDAMAQLRNQMNLPAGIDMMADYVAASQSGTAAAQYQTMHANAQKMAGLMAGQAGLVMNGSGGVYVNRYRSMMGTINSNMPAIAVNTSGSTFMTGMSSQMGTQLATMQTSGGGFTNYSGMFRNMTSNRYFWRTSTGSTTPITPMSGSMM